MLIHVDEIKDGGLTLDFEEKVDSFPVLQKLEAEGECHFCAPVRVHLKAVLISGMVEVDGYVESKAQLECSRCLIDFEAPVKTSFQLTFTEELPQIEEETGEEEIEVSAEEMGLILYEGETIDLRPAVQEQVVMALPLRPLCKEGCKGLCPQCGANLNEVSCECEKPLFNSKFAALKDFKVKK